MMGRYVLRADVQNFSDSIFDSNDLSTFRGGSIAALRIGSGVENALKSVDCTDIKLLFAGASKCGFSFESVKDGEDVAKHVRAELAAPDNRLHSDDSSEKNAFHETDSIPFNVLTIAVSVLPDSSNKDESKTLADLEAINRARQYRDWTLKPELFNSDIVIEDPLQGTRGGSQKVFLPKGKRGLMTIDEDNTGSKTNEGRLNKQNADVCRLSSHVAQRRKFGRYARQSFYNYEIKRNNDDVKRKEIHADCLVEEMKDFPSSIISLDESLYSFTDSLQDMVSVPPKGLPASLRNSISVIYADGNGFGKIVKQIGEIEFDLQIRKLQASLLRNLMMWLKQGAVSQEHDAFCINDEQLKRAFLRFETLMWGGEEMTFALPSWLALPFVERFLAWTKGWKIDGQPLTFAIGVVIANAKTPIRQLRQIASDAADACKNFQKDGQEPLRSVNTVSIEIFESISPPDAGLDEYRHHIYFAGPAKNSVLSNEELAARLAFPGDQFAEVLDQMRRIVLGGTDRPAIPRSQLYRVLRDMRTGVPVGLADKTADQQVDLALREHARRAGGDVGFKVEHISLPDLNSQIGNNRGSALNLAQAITLWDYAVPLSGRILDVSRAQMTGEQP